MAARLYRRILGFTPGFDVNSSRRPSPLPIHQIWPYKKVRMVPEINFPCEGEKRTNTENLGFERTLAQQKNNLDIGNFNKSKCKTCQLVSSHNKTTLKQLCRGRTRTLI